MIIVFNMIMIKLRERERGQSTGTLDQTHSKPLSTACQNKSDLKRKPGLLNTTKKTLMRTADKHVLTWQKSCACDTRGLDHLCRFRAVLINNFNPIHFLIRSFWLAHLQEEERPDSRQSESDEFGSTSSSSSGSSSAAWMSSYFVNHEPS